MAVMDSWCVGANMVEDVVEDVVFAGGVTNFRVRTTDDVVLTAKCLASEPRFKLTAGMPIRLGWCHTDAVILEPWNRPQDLAANHAVY